MHRNNYAGIKKIMKVSLHNTQLSTIIMATASMMVLSDYTYPNNVHDCDIFSLAMIQWGIGWWTICDKFSITRWSICADKFSITSCFLFGRCWVKFEGGCGRMQVKWIICHHWFGMTIDRWSTRFHLKIISWCGWVGWRQHRCSGSCMWFS